MMTPIENPDVYGELKAEVDRIVPYLLESRWYPMTYMAIPKLLKDADELIARMEKADAGRHQIYLNKLLESLKMIRNRFERISEGP